MLPTFAKLFKTKPDYRAIEQQLFDTFSVYLDKLAEQQASGLDQLGRDAENAAKELA